jgi:hypothetical protein
MQHQIRANAIEVREITADLFSWEDEKNNKKPQSAPRRPTNTESFPIRGKVESDEEEEKKKRNEGKKKRDELARDLKRDGNTISGYYNAWEKFDVVWSSDF